MNKRNAGSLEFGPNGNLFIATGDNTSPRATGYSPSDEREGRSPWDAQKSSGNTNDLRGKILRIKPEADGTYSIPDENLFAEDGSEGKPEIYVMGCRNPYRISIDSKCAPCGPTAIPPKAACWYNTFFRKVQMKTGHALILAYNKV